MDTLNDKRKLVHLKAFSKVFVLLTTAYMTVQKGRLTPCAEKSPSLRKDDVTKWIAG